MQPTSHPQVDALLSVLLPRLQAALGEHLVGLYLYGSLVTGDFDLACSDIDLVAVTATDVNEPEFAALQQMHATIIAAYPQWDNRIEVAYLSAAALQTFRTERSQIVVISPGEPLNVKDAGADWLMNWYVVRQQGVALFGPDARTLIPDITREEFIASLRHHADGWPGQMEHYQTRKAQAYIMLTVCRTLYAIATGEQASKKQAALWVAGHWPQWANTVQNALQWRSAPDEEAVDHAATYPQTVRFVEWANGQMHSDHIAHMPKTF